MHDFDPSVYTQFDVAPEGLWQQLSSAGRFVQRFPLLLAMYQVASTDWLQGSVRAKL